MVTFFGLHLYLVGKRCENFKVPGAPSNSRISRRNHLLYYFSKGTIYLHIASFYAKKYFRKIRLKNKMLIEQIIEFELRRPWSPGRICTPTTVYFQNKTKISQKNLQVDHYLVLKYTSLPYTWVKSFPKFNPKMQDFNGVLDLNCKYRTD